MTTTLSTYTCQTCGHTAINYPTSGIVDEHGVHHAEDSEQAHVRFHADMTALGIDIKPRG